MRCEQSALTLPLSGNMRMWCGRRAAGSGRKRQTKTEAENTATETTAAATENKTQTDHKILPPHLHGKLIRSLSNSLTQSPSLRFSLSLSVSRSHQSWGGEIRCICGRATGKSFRHLPFHARPASARRAPRSSRLARTRFGCEH